MTTENRSRLVRLYLKNIGCVGSEGLEVSLDKVVCLVGKNNAGKSTVLRAYELAKGSATFENLRDRHKQAGVDDVPEVILDVHIPDGIANIDSSWKIEQDGLKIVRSRWQWAGEPAVKSRTSWNPQLKDGAGDWDPEKKASGLDNVFTSRLPRPIRIGSLEDAEKTQDLLLTLALAPLIANVEKERQKEGSALSNCITGIAASINELSTAHEKHFNEIARKVTTGFKGVFPSLGVKLNIEAAPLVPKVEDLVRRGSGLLVADGKVETSLIQQGTGARRALFWSMLQVHNELARDKEVRDDYHRTLEKSIAEAAKIPKKESEENAAIRLSNLATLQAKLAAHDDGAPIPDSPDDPALPGYLLLIDEPENALHPLAARAAQRHLYDLGTQPDWQVMITTHSPYFINPFSDHTTIVRLERPDAESQSHFAPKTYRSDSVNFQGNEKQQLQALQQMDPSFAEIFFGSYPILVEGDTEHAAFLAANTEDSSDLANRATIVRARGKAILRPLIKVLTHFRIAFGIVHDCDPPFRSDGSNNGMWTENMRIREEILNARKNGIVVRHRVSIPDFERYLGGDEESKDKPHRAYAAIKADPTSAAKVQSLFLDLVDGTQHEPFAENIFLANPDYTSILREQVLTWAAQNGLESHIRFAGTHKS